MIGVYPTKYVTPVSVYYEKNTGKTQPITFQCMEDGRADFQFYVVKLFEKTMLKQRSVMREIFVSKLAIYFGLQTPEPALVEITQELLEAYRGTYTFGKLEKSLGINFGSKELTTAIIYTDERIPPEFFEDAAEIFAFDVLIFQQDRRKGNSNLFINNDGLYIFDHEDTFYNVVPGMVLGGVPPITDSAAIQSVFQNHVLIDKIKGNPTTLNGFTEKLSQFTSETFDAMIDGFPHDWNYEELENIKEYLLGIAKQANVFQKSITEVLS